MAGAVARPGTGGPDQGCGRRCPRDPSCPSCTASVISPRQRITTSRRTPTGGVRGDPLHPLPRHPRLEHRPAGNVLPGHQHMRGRPPARHRVHVLPIRERHPHQRLTPVPGRGHIGRRTEGRTLIHADAHAPDPTTRPGPGRKRGRSAPRTPRPARRWTRRGAVLASLRATPPRGCSSPGQPVGEGHNEATRPSRRCSGLGAGAEGITCSSRPRTRTSTGVPGAVVR